MPKNTTVPPVAPPPGMDLDRIEAAMRDLAETAVAEEARVAAQNGGALPDYTDNASARAICMPVSTACRTAYGKLSTHLVNLIGYRAASEICQRISHDVRDEAAVLTAQPSTARH